MRRKVSNRKTNKSYAFVVDGETESWYLKLMKRHEKLDGINIKPELPKNNKLSEQYERVMELAKEDYDKVYWIIDLDVVINESNEAKNKQTALQKLKDYKDEFKNSKKIEILINNPCLEFWFLLHITITSKYYANSNDIINEYKDSVLCDYEKSDKYYNKPNNDIYKKLKEYQKDAIERAKYLKFNFDNPTSKCIAEIFKIFTDLKICS